MFKDATTLVANDTLSALLASAAGGGAVGDRGGDITSSTARSNVNLTATQGLAPGTATQGLAPNKRRRTIPSMASQDLGSQVSGDEAFAVLYAEMYPDVVGIVLRVLRDRAMAEEVAQDVMLEAWRKADRFDPSRGSARAWISTLARRRAVDRVRSEQAGRDRDERVFRRDAVAPRDEVADEVEVKLEHWQVRRALQVLTDRQREAIELAYFEGHTYRDVAEVLGIPEGTAKSRLRDGLQRLSAELQDLA